MRIFKDKRGYFLGLSEDKSAALKAKMGKPLGNKLYLHPLEAFYLKEVKGAEGEVDMPPLLEYIAYRELRLKGYYPLFSEVKGKEKVMKRYAGEKIPITLTQPLSNIGTHRGYVIIKKHEELYNKYWMGQMGFYKKAKKGIFHVLDRFEAYLLYELGMLSLTKKEVKEIKDMKHFNEYYAVFKAWRNKGYVVKSGFKFGADFRIYMPGISPSRFSHSKHVLHVFPKGFSMKVEELSRAIRVANSVKKTFILAVPEEKGKSKPTFYLLGKDKKPLYACKVYSQEDIIKSKEISALLSKASSLNLSLLIAIVDRETSLTLYNVEEIRLGKGKYKYYEVRWINA